jgi:hypothetical protein
MPWEMTPSAVLSAMMEAHRSALSAPYLLLKKKFLDPFDEFCSGDGHGAVPRRIGIETESV